MSDRGDFLNPDYEPGEFDHVERRLRRALQDEAQRVQPGDRLDDILAGAREAGPEQLVQPAHRRWLAPAAAAAAVAVIAGALWAANRGPEVSAPPAASSSTTQPTGAPTPTSSPTTAPTTTGSTTPTTPSTTVRPPSTERPLLPVYYVGPVGGDREVYRLFREFLRSEVAVDTTSDAAKAKAALVLAINAQPFSNTDGYLQPWSGQTIGDVTVTPDLITIALANAGPEGFTEDTERVAVQQLVWTAQAAVGKGTIPVRFEIADGSTALFGTLPTDQSYNRPASRDEYYRDLAPLWITAPTRDQVLPAGKPFVVKGEATVFEANVSWELRRGSTTVDSGFTTASVGAPGRGEYSIQLGALEPGDYTIRVFELSMEDGQKVNAEDFTPFSVK